ncbi:MAG TPA: ankyrin repeat domain-containing protein [Oculatellaceae cyanobacterium]
MQKRALAALTLAVGIWTFAVPFEETASASPQTDSPQTDTQSKAIATRNIALLQGAVNHLNDKPLWAEQILKSSPYTSAKVYLAYLYLTKRVPVQNRNQKVQTLMEQAVEKAESEFGGSDWDVQPDTEYKSIYPILRAMRFINEAEDTSIAIPEFIFRSYPKAAFDAFGSFWGSSKDGMNHVPWSREIENVPSAKQFINIVEDMQGSPPPNCFGTIMHAFYRTQAIALMKASIAPQVFKPSADSTEIQKNARQCDAYLLQWSNEELWNKVMYEKLLAARKQAIVDVSKSYQKRFKFDEKLATQCAATALDAIEGAYISTPSEPDQETTQNAAKNQSDKLKMLVCQNKSTAQDIKKCLAGRKPEKEELRELLRLAILNHGNTDLIKWLIDQGAPLSGGRETALFSAVRRPEVVTLLLKNGAAVDATNKLGKTALFQALQFDCFKSVELLCEAGADIKHPMLGVKEAIDPNVFNDDTCDYNYTVGGRTPLMYAAAFASYPVVKYMLEKGVDIKATDSEGAMAGKFLAQNPKLSATERKELLITLPEKK